MSAAADSGTDASVRSIGCSAAEPLTEGEHTFTLGGRDRRFVLRLPKNYRSDRAWPLVFALHGNGGNTAYWDVTSGGRNIRAVLEDEAILIVAEAIEGNWRDSGADASTRSARLEEELAYFDELVSRASESLCVREDAIFTVGFSGGGSFSGVLGCRRSYIRAIAAGGAVIYFDPADCVQAPPAWITIGARELTAGRQDFRDYFRDQASCTEKSTPTDPNPPCVAYEMCDVAVHYCQHDGDHVWPELGTTAFWAFFSQFLR